MKRLFACLLVLALLSALPLAAMAKPLPAVSIIGPGSFTYSGLPNCPVLQMIDGSYTLIEGVDYTVEYYSNVDVPGGTWTVYPLGIYTNARSDQLIINKAPLPTINAIPDQVYTGSAITPALSLNPALPLHNFNIVYSNNTAAGQAKVTLTSKGTNVEGGSVSANFNIQYLFLPLPPIASLAYTTIPYDGSAKTPAVTITGLVLDRDFTVSYQKNTAVGTAQASATGMGNYTGVSTASFEITHTHVWGAWKDNDDRKTHSRNCSALPTHSQTADCTFKEELFPPTCTEGGYTQFTCTVCGFGYWDFFTDPTGHTWGDCLSNNDATHTCTCKTDPSHKWTEGCTFSATVVAPTCEQGGYTEHVCDLCGYTYQDAVTKPTGHDWGAWTANQDGSHSRACKTDPLHTEKADCVYTDTVTPPTCTDDGLTTHVCQVCGYTYTDAPTKALGHDWGAWTTNKDGSHSRACKTDPLHTETPDCVYTDNLTPPTCTDDGYTTHVCQVCGYTYTDTPTKALGHDWGAWTTNKDGSHSRACKTDPLHTEKADCVYTDTFTPPTCTDNGFTTHVCQVCNYTYADALTKATGHDWGAWTANQDSSHSRVCKTDPLHTEKADCDYTNTLTPPTCTGDGFTTHICQVCGDTYTDAPTKATGHDWGGWTANKDGTHSHVCKTDPLHTEKAECVYTDTVTAPTCTENGFTTHVCQVCGYTYTDTPTKALGHDWGAWTTNKDGTHSRACKTDAKHTERADCVYTDTITSPTCTGNGFTTHVCQVCSDTYTDTPIKALGHDWGAWTANKDGTHSRVCKRDAGHAETAACAYTAVVTAPTCTEGGYSDFTCAACGHSYRGAFTAALGHQPGDWQTVKRPTDLRRGEEVLACQLCGTPLDSQTLPRLTHIEGRTATLEGDEFPDMMGRDFRIRYMSLPLDLEKDSVWEARVIASNRYVIGTLTITLKEGQLLLSFQPADPTVVIRQAYLTLFAGDPAEFVQQDLDLVEEQPLPLDEWFPLKALDGAAGQSHLFLRFDVNFDTTGLAIVTLP